MASNTSTSQPLDTHVFEIKKYQQRLFLDVWETTDNSSAILFIIRCSLDWEHA